MYDQKERMGLHEHQTERSQNMNHRMLRCIVLVGLAGSMAGFTVQAEEKQVVKSRENPVLTFDGEIATIERDQRKLTVRKIPVSKTFLVAKDCKFTITDKPDAALEDLKVGDKVKVKYEEGNEGLMA